MAIKVGESTYMLNGKVGVTARACVAGPIEGEGSLGEKIDMVYTDEKNGMKSWELAEAKMQEDVLNTLLVKSGLESKDIDWLLAGDLLNQCTASSTGLKNAGIPMLGLYGACSTMAESMLIGAILLEAGAGGRTICMTSSHYCSSEKQFRFPVELGGQRPKSAQSTVTASGGVILQTDGGQIAITAVTPGTIQDLGITDANNMGAAMAPAAASVIATHLKDTGRAPEYYDAIFTGDLGFLGKEMCIQLTGELGYDITNVLWDCGTMVYAEKEVKDTAGASGCGCSALVLTADILARMESGEMNKVLFVGTGALHSPTMLNEKQSIPGIASGVVFERRAM